MSTQHFSICPPGWYDDPDLLNCTYSGQNPDKATFQGCAVYGGLDRDNASPTPPEIQTAANWANSCGIWDWPGVLPQLPATTATGVGTCPPGWTADMTRPVAAGSDGRPGVCYYQGSNPAALPAQCGRILPLPLNPTPDDISGRNAQAASCNVTSWPGVVSE